MQQFVANPGERDVPVSQVFTESMWQELDKIKSVMADYGMHTAEELGQKAVAANRTAGSSRHHCAAGIGA